MRMQYPVWRAIIVGLLLISTAGCTAAGEGGTPTPSVTAANVVAGGGTNNSGSPTPSATPTDTPTPTPTLTPTLTPTPTPTPTLTPTPNVTPEVSQGPFVVKQIEVLGHEAISGVVCSVKNPFIVVAVAPEVSWNFVFSPQGSDHGTLTYAYSIPSAGESHDAHGTYTLSRAAPDGTLLLSMTVSDHVVFKGFDGNIPVHYKFDLVPTNAACPPGG